MKLGKQTLEKKDIFLSAHGSLVMPKRAISGGTRLNFLEHLDKFCNSLILSCQKEVAGDWKGFYR